MGKAQGMTSSAHDLTSFFCCFNFNIWLFFFSSDQFSRCIKAERAKAKGSIYLLLHIEKQHFLTLSFCLQIYSCFQLFFQLSANDILGAAVFFCGDISGLFQYLIPVLNLWLQTTSCSHTLECPDNEWKSLNKRAESDITQENKMYNTFKQWVCSLCRN